MVRRASIAAVLSVLCIIPLCRAQSWDVPVEALRTQAAAVAADAFEGADAVAVFDRREVEVADSGLSRMVQHTLTKVLTRGGARLLATSPLAYDPLSADVELLRCRVLVADGSVREVAPADALDVPDPQSAIYWGSRHKLVPVGRLEPGDAVELVTRRVGFTYALLDGEGADEQRFVPPMRGHFYDIVPFWGDHPIVEQSYRVRIPLDKHLQYKVYNGAAEISDLIEDSRRVVTVIMRDLKPLKREPGMVALSDVAPKLLLTTARDWKAKALWFHGVQEDAGAFTVTAEVQAIADEVTRGLSRDEDKVAALNHWVAENIRYVGLHMGKGEGYTLHPASMTLRDRGGVCKDKAGILVALLRAAGLESYPAMTMAGERIERLAADQFNHCVTVWRRPDGATVLLDPTWVPGVREMWSSREQQQEVLMGLPEGADLLTTALSPAADHPLDVTVRSRLDADGTLSGTLELKADGQSDAGLRRLYRGRPRDAWPGLDEMLIADLEPRARVELVSRTDPDDLSKPFAISLRFRIPGYARTLEDGSLALVPLVARHPVGAPTRADELSMSTKPETRRFPARIGCTKLVRLSERMALPPGAKVSGLPEAIDLTGTGELRAAWRVERGELIVDEVLSLNARIIEPGQWPSLRAALEAFRTLGKTVVLITRSAAKEAA